MGIKRRLRSLLFVLVLAAGVGGCYVPTRFDAAITVTRQGFYEIQFEGEIAWAPLFRQIRKGELTPAEQQEKVERIRADLSRDSAAREIAHVGRGVFQLNWRKSGDLLERGMVTFLRRNEDIFRLKYLKDEGVILVTGKTLSKRNAEQLAAEGLTIAGDIRVMTDARVIDHNAATVSDQGIRGRVYTWRMRSPLDPAPRLVIAVR